ncbi:hypothetical protein BDN70DRAFT_978665 [Pholiota conissans]|uniref:Fido domain-containing protein n=1 Tax=Pholiota conissans TaxID=109636 RepID=A0A9P5YM58_9AGAR|nr:hypothetical protein BDN70DRAFT_978665 [Pholiota conissans]
MSSSKLILKSKIFTSTYVACINAQLVSPAHSQIVKPHELPSALARPLQVAHYQPEKCTQYLAATLSYGLIMGHPFLDGNKRTAFFLQDQYLKALDSPEVVPDSQLSKTELDNVAELHNSVACGTLDVEGVGKRVCVGTEHKLHPA